MADDARSGSVFDYMTAENGHAERLGRVETEHRDLRQLVLDEIALLREELEHVAEQAKYNGQALDEILKLLKAMELHEDAEDRRG